MRSTIILKKRNEGKAECFLSSINPIEISGKRKLFFFSFIFDKNFGGNFSYVCIRYFEEKEPFFFLFIFNRNVGINFFRLSLMEILEKKEISFLSIFERNFGKKGNFFSILCIYIYIAMK